MRKTLMALLAVLALFALGACGASGGDDEGSGEESTETTAAEGGEDTEPTETTEAESDTVDVEAWAGDFCGAFGDWIDEIQAASTDVSSEVTPGDIESAKTAIANLFQSASDSTQNLISDLEAAGSPDIEDGDQLVADLIERFESFDELAQDAKADTEALEADASTFQADTEELTQRFQDGVDDVADSFTQLDTDYPSPDLSAALTESCDFL